MVQRDTIIELGCAGPPVLACGAWLKNTVCVTRGSTAYVSQLIGDLGTPEACRMLEQSVERLCSELDVQPEIVAHDLHPDFFSSQFARMFAASRGLPVIAVQHHHAHIAALCAEHHIDEPILGLAFDGVGLGTDGTAWGGELLRVGGSGFERIGYLSPLALPGSDRAAQEPWRMAAAVLFRLGRGDEIAARFSGQRGAGMIAAMLQRGLNCPPTSSMGRLFDAAAGVLGICEVQEFEAQAAIAMEKLAGEYGRVAPLGGGYCIDDAGRLDFMPLLTRLVDCSDQGYGAALFHSTLVEGLVEWVVHKAGRLKLASVALGGGCFHNAILSQQMSDQLSGQGLRVLTARHMQPNDSAISLGQAWIAIRQAG